MIMTIVTMTITIIVYNDDSNDDDDDDNDVVVNNRKSRSLQKISGIGMREYLLNGTFIILVFSKSELNVSLSLPLLIRNFPLSNI